MYYLIWFIFTFTPSFVLENVSKFNNFIRFYLDLEANTKPLTQVCNVALWRCHALVYYLFIEVNISRNNYGKFDMLPSLSFKWRQDFYVDVSETRFTIRKRGDNILMVGAFKWKFYYLLFRPAAIVIVGTEIWYIHEIS